MSVRDAQYWRIRAEEIRARAGETKDPEGKLLILRIAEEFDRLADQAKAMSPPLQSSAVST